MRRRPHGDAAAELYDRILPLPEARTLAAHDAIERADGYSTRMVGDIQEGLSVARLVDDVEADMSADHTGAGSGEVSVLTRWEEDSVLRPPVERLEDPWHGDVGLVLEDILTLEHGLAPYKGPSAPAPVLTYTPSRGLFQLN